MPMTALAPRDFFILAVLADGASHGYGSMMPTAEGRISPVPHRAAGHFSAQAIAASRSATSMMKMPANAEGREKAVA
jgi:hypothetical protein